MIGKNVRKDIYKRATRHWGEHSQMMAAIEEFSELINELSKKFNGKNKRGIEGIIDELADCRIMIEQLEMNFCIEKEVDVRMDEKLRKIDSTLKGAVRPIDKFSRYKR